MATDRIDEGEGGGRGYSVGERERESKGEGENDRYFSPDDRALQVSLFLHRNNKTFWINLGE